MDLPRSKRRAWARFWYCVLCTFGVLEGAQNIGPRANAAEGESIVRARSTLRIWGVPGDGDAAPLVFLDRPQEPGGDGPRPDLGSRGLLLREIARQAVLMAARDGCGARTRDAVLGDVGGDGKPSATLVLEWEYPIKGKSIAQLRRESGEVLWQAPSLADDEAKNPLILAEALGNRAMSALIDAMVKAGLTRDDRKPGAADAIPPEVEKSLSRMTELSQFAAVRGLHDRMRKTGGSPALLGGLARSYALLGVLTEHHWAPAHKVYKARALLYGQRAATSDPKSPAGLWSLSFAEALIGRQSEALRHLADADRVAGPAKRPSWADRVGPFARDEAGELIAVAASKEPLARLLAFLVVEGSSGIYEDESDVARVQILKAASELLALEPNCLRVHDAACRFSGVSLLHAATVVGPRLFEGSLRKSVGEMPGVPAGLGADLAKALDEAGRGADRGEPSLSALASLVRETRFVQAWRRKDFLTLKLGAPALDGPDTGRELVAAHPLLPFLLAHDRGFDRAEFATFARALEKTDIELTAMPVISRVRRIDPTFGDRLFDRAVGHGDEVARDLHEAIRYEPNDKMTALATRLQAVRPNSPIARIVLVESEKGVDPKLAEEWEKDPMAGPGLLGAMGRQHVAGKRWADAERCLSRAITASPEVELYRSLAGAYKAQGLNDKWRETLEASLAHEDYALDHARVQDEIARDYITRKQYKEALPYAEAAAQSGAAWAMYTASSCLENVGRWDEAEAMVRGISQRYGEDAAAWFWWCQRTEHGDLQSALAFAKPRLPALSRAVTADPERAMNFGNVLIAGKEPRLALELTRRCIEQKFDLNLAIRIATLADGLGEPALRTQALDQVAHDTQPIGLSTKKGVGLIREWFARPDAEKSGPDLARMDELLASMPRGRGNLAYFVGLFLGNHGRMDESAAYLAIAAGRQPPGTTDERYRILARLALRERGLDPDKITPRPLPEKGADR